MRHIILIDANYLCHRAFHTTGHLAFEGDVTGVLFGVFRAIETVIENLKGSPVFCFDHGQSLRAKKLTTYKSGRQAKRDAMDDEDKRIYQKFQEQINLLREQYLPAMGYANVFSKPGFEADDIIASIAKDIEEGELGTIVSADSDLWQLIKDCKVRCYNPTRDEYITEKSLFAKYRITPNQWVHIKAIAGDTSDDIVGVKGVGIVTAAKFVRGELNSGKKSEDIQKGLDLWMANMDLVSLPYPGTPTYQIRPDAVTDQKWNDVVRALGMHSLVRGRAGKQKERKHAEKDQGFNT